MPIDKTLLSGSSGMLILSLLSENDMYGYQITAELARRSEDTFKLKAGTLYPLLHSLEEKGYIRSYEIEADSGKVRKYYNLTAEGHSGLNEKTSEWKQYTEAVNSVLKGGMANA